MTYHTRARGWRPLAVAVAVWAAWTTMSPAADRVTPLPAGSAHLSAPALARQIDTRINQQMAAEKVKASPIAGDAEFLRRAYLDITGIIPPADKAAAFLASRNPNKRAKLIDELLASPQYGRHMADIWQALLFPHNSDNRRLREDPLVDWLKKGFNDNKPWDQFVTELLTATGPVDKNGAVTFFLANPAPDKLTDLTSKLFLGVQLQCAQCHNHPFTKWKQTDYWGMAAFFTKVRANGRPNAAAKNGTVLAISENERARGKRAKLPESAKIVPAKFFLGEEPTLSASEPYRPVLARWLTSADNPYFARAMVNRMWGHFFGRGFVNPVDNMSEDNPPSHPELLKELADQFAANGFDLKYLIRAICTSQTYQRSSKPAAGNDKDTTLFSHMAVKSLSPEQLYDSLKLVLGDPVKASKPGRGRKGVNPPKKRGAGNNPRNQFVTFFQVEEGADQTEYQAGIPQALRLMNSGEFNTARAAVLAQVERSGRVPAAVVQQLYLATLTRRPTAAETHRLTAYIAKTRDHHKAYSDILWALLNSSEFALNH